MVFALVAVAAVVFLAIKLLDRPALVSYARPVGDQTLALGTVTGPAGWTRVTAVQEASDRIVITVSSLSAPLPGSGDDLTELTVQLSAPLGGRTVVDGNTGEGIPVTTCPPPAYLAPGCTQPGARSPTGIQLGLAQRFW